MENESDVLDWMIDQKADESIEEIERDTLFEYISSKDFLAVIFCKFSRSFIKIRTKDLFLTKFLSKNFFWLNFIRKFRGIKDDPENPDSRRVLRHLELIDDEASEYGITIVKTIDKLMAKKYGYRKLPGITYFRKGNYATKICIMRTFDCYDE